jgi:hypothetical protein
MALCLVRFNEIMPSAETAAALVRRPVDVIATFGTPASFAAKQATNIPIRDQRRAAPLIFRYDIPFIAARRPL